MGLYETRINDVLPRTFGAELVSYSVGQAGYSRGYSVPPSAMKPVPLNPIYSTREIALTFDFSGEDQHLIALGISRMTANMQQKNSIIQLPDGFYYHCNFVSASEPSEKAPWIWQVKFHLTGWRTSAIEHYELTTSGVIVVDGNITTPAIVFITPSNSGDVTIGGFTFRNGVGSITIYNCTGNVTVDGVAKTVMDENMNNLFASTNLTEFPCLSAGDNEITITGEATVDIRFWPAFL